LKLSKEAPDFVKELVALYAKLSQLLDRVKSLAKREFHIRRLAMTKKKLRRFGYCSKGGLLQMRAV